MARFFVAYLDPASGKWVGVPASDADQAFDAGGGSNANSQAALQSGKAGKYAAFPIDGAGIAAFTTTCPNANSNVVYTAVGGGAIGNSITIRYVVAGTNTALTVSVTGRDITVNVATNGGGAATSTATLVMAAVNAHAVAQTLVGAVSAPSNDGSGVVAAFAAQNLIGGTTGVATVEVVSLTSGTSAAPDAW